MRNVSIQQEKSKTIINNLLKQYDEILENKEYLIEEKEKEILRKYRGKLIQLENNSDINLHRRYEEISKEFKEFRNKIYAKATLEEIKRNGGLKKKVFRKKIIKNWEHIEAKKKIEEIVSFETIKLKRKKQNLKNIKSRKIILLIGGMKEEREALERILLEGFDENDIIPKSNKITFHLKNENIREIKTNRKQKLYNTKEAIVSISHEDSVLKRKELKEVVKLFENDVEEKNTWLILSGKLELRNIYKEIIDQHKTTEIVLDSPTPEKLLMEIEKIATKWDYRFGSGVKDEILGYLESIETENIGSDNLEDILYQIIQKQSKRVMKEKSEGYMLIKTEDVEKILKKEMKLL